MTFQNYLNEVQLLTQVLNDLRRVDSLTKDLTINMLKTNPGQLIWVAKSIQQTIDGIIERTENASEKTDLQKVSARLKLVSLDDIQLHVAGMSALLDADERQDEEDLEEKINKAKKTFL